MPITKSAKKTHKSSLKKRGFNIKRKREMKESIKNVEKSISEKDKKGANEKLSDAYKAIDKAAKRGVIKKNTAARKKSRLARKAKEE